MKKSSAFGQMLLSTLVFFFGATSYAGPVDLVKLLKVSVVGITYEKHDTKKMTPEPSFS